MGCRRVRQLAGHRHQLSGRGHGDRGHGGADFADVRVFTLDTGRLPEETYRMIETVRERYGIAVEIVVAGRCRSGSHGGAARSEPVLSRGGAAHALLPDSQSAAAGAQAHGELNAWVTGLRRDQNESRADVRKVEEMRRPIETQSAGRLDRRDRWTNTSASTTVPVHPLYAAGYTQHRLRALHARRSAGRGRARGPLVVGAGRRQRMRHSFLARTAKPSARSTSC